MKTIFSLWLVLLVGFVLLVSPPPSKAWLAQVPASGGGGSITLVNKSGNGCSAASCATTLNVTAGNLLAVGCFSYNTATKPTVSDTPSNTFTTPVSDNTLANFWATLYYAKNVAGNSSDSISCAASGATQTWIIALQYSGANTSTPLDTQSSGVNNSCGGVTCTATTGSMTAAGTNEMLTAFTSVYGVAGCSFSITANSGALTLTNEQGDGGGQVEGSDSLSGTGFSSPVQALTSSCGAIAGAVVVSALFKR